MLQSQMDVSNLEEPNFLQHNYVEFLAIISY